jgi:hypothetical protein
VRRFKVLSDAGEPAGEGITWSDGGVVLRLHGSAQAQSFDGLADATAFLEATRRKVEWVDVELYSTEGSEDEAPPTKR